MMKTQYPYKENLTKWFLTVTLLLGIFASSGYANNLQSRQLQTTPTELVHPNNSKICTRAISYKKGIELSLFIAPLNSFDKNWTNALNAYNLLTKVKLDNFSRLFYFHKPANLFLQVKIIPQNSDEDIFATYIG